MLALEVADNGRGFPDGGLKDARSGNGLRNMRERMDAIGGTFDLAASVDGGTRLVFHAPLPLTNT